MRRPSPSSFRKPVDLTCKVAYAACRNLYSAQVSGLEHPGLHVCVCEAQKHGQTCDQMNRIALAVIQTIVQEMKSQ